MPVYFNSRSKEPYLRLPAPHSNIILTSHNLEHSEETYATLIETLNDPRVYPWLEGPPYPYSREDAERWVNSVYNENKGVLESLRAEFSEGSMEARKFYDVSPFSCIREVVEEDPVNGDPIRDVFIGTIGLTRYSFYEYPCGSEERAEAQRNNNALPAGDEKIVWGIGYSLAPSHHGRGIMTSVVKTLLRDWAVPCMNVQNLKSSAYVENRSSLRILEKTNFEIECVLKDFAPVSESRGGGKRSIVVLKWRGL
ncbi:acetyltransferase [Aspergillus sclerotialis]|uniref:Acetyltransferase n=1 Tax=Aspergillus sclerotialis TaxID=2070753 RepID=A0A3A3AC85_9EURO|nr:acetyltransferase [Aspergillus sclerotialis]